MDSKELKIREFSDVFRPNPDKGIYPAPLNAWFVSKPLLGAVKTIIYNMDTVYPGGSPATLKQAYFKTDLTLTSEDGKQSIKFVDAVCKILQTNTPVSTSLVGLAGTIKEGVAMGDYTITITAALVANQLGNWEQADFYPQDDVKDLARMLNKAQTLTVESAFLALFGINRLVVKEFTIDQTTQSNWQAVTIKADSDQDYTINYNEY